jgi:hypothetical protein
MLSKELTAKLLNRSLTTAETNNFSLYLKIATQRLEELLCFSLSSDAGERTFETRVNYRSVYVDPFTSIESITIDGEEYTGDYQLKQNDNLNGSWFNIIEFEKVRDGKNIVVDADWGFDSCPVDLQFLLAQIFAHVSVEQTTDNQVKSKKIEDFTVTYKDGATFTEFVLANRSILDKYSYCNQGFIRHGNLQPVFYN